MAGGQTRQNKTTPYYAQANATVTTRGGTGLNALISSWRLLCFENSIHRQVTCQVKQDRELWHSTLIQEAEQAAGKGDLRTLYSIVNRLAPGTGRPMAGVHNSLGQPCATEQEEGQVWRKHLGILVNATSLEDGDAPTMGVTSRPLSAICPEHRTTAGMPTLEEMEMSLRRQRLMKGYPNWSVPTETFRLGGI